MGIKVSNQGNAIAFLELDPELTYFHDVIRFLVCCPLSHAFRDNPIMSKKVLNHFWSTDVLNGPTHIRYKISGQILRFTPDDVADALCLPRDVGVSSYGRDVLKAQFEAIGFHGDFKIPSRNPAFHQSGGS